MIVITRCSVSVFVVFTADGGNSRPVTAAADRLGAAHYPAAAESHAESYRPPVYRLLS